jgi:hypothetical protein
VAGSNERRRRAINLDEGCMRRCLAQLPRIARRDNAIAIPAHDEQR